MLVVLALVSIVDLVVDSYLASQRTQLRSTISDRWQPARDLTAVLLFNLVDQETAQRGYIITGDARFLADYAASGSAVDEAALGLETVVAGDPDLAPQLRRSRNRIDAWRQLGAAYEIEAKQAGRDEAAVALVSTGTSKTLFDEARVEINDLRQTVIDVLTDQDEALTRLQRRAQLLRWVLAAVALGAVLGSGRLLNRWLSRPLGAVADAVRTVAAGRLDHQIPSPGPPELADLGADVESMRRRILVELDDATRARASLEQRGMIVLTLREELAPPVVAVPSGLRVATRFRPSESLVAGDWYDLRSGETTLTFVVADVSGHGPSAGVFALKTKQLVTIALDQGREPAAAWEWVSDHLGDTFEQFLTGVIGVVDVTRASLTYASAGHPALLLYGPAGVGQLGPTGPIIGPFPGEWSQAEVPFGPGSGVVAYSDGLLEVQGEEGAWAEVGALVDELGGHPTTDPEMVAERCLAFHERHDARDHRDDVTVVVLGAC